MFDGAIWTVYNTSNSGLPHNNVAHLAIDAEENLWIGTDNGLAQFDTQSWMVYKTSNSGLPNNTIWALAVDAQDNIWIGTYGSGLAKFDGKNWTTYKTSNSGLPDNRIYCLTVDAQGNLWIGTENGGVAVYHIGEQLPIVDFNGDGIVDIKDLVRLIESWGQDDPVVDIAPPPFGDGVVDALDLELLMSFWGQPVDDPTLIAHWALDEIEGITAHDSVNGYDDYVMGGALWQPAGGVIDGALELDGVDDCLITSFSPNPAEGPLSVVAWVKGGAPDQVIISQPLGADWLSMDTEGNLMTELKSAGRDATTLLSQAVITDEQWHRIGLVWDGWQRMLCVDGVAVAEDTQDDLEASTGGLYIGVGKNYTVGTFFSGLIDDVRFYNRAVSP